MLKNEGLVKWGGVKEIGWWGSQPPWWIQRTLPPGIHVLQHYTEMTYVTNKSTFQVALCDPQGWVIEKT